MELVKRIALSLLCLCMLFLAACAIPKTEAPTEPAALSTELTETPTAEPTQIPTEYVTAAPTVAPTTAPTTKPTTKPTVKPTTVPTTKPTAAPTTAPTTIPTTAPTIAPTTTPTTASTSVPTEAPTTAPTTQPTSTQDNPVKTDKFDDTLSKADLPAVTSRFPALEELIYEKTNAERVKQGLSTVTWEEKAYFFANTRAYEASVQWSHTRPNGELFYDIFHEYGVDPVGCGENLFSVSYDKFTADYIASATEEMADMAVSGWMDSPGHRENILTERWASMVVGVYYDEQAHAVFAVQLFFA